MSRVMRHFMIVLILLWGSATSTAQISEPVPSAKVDEQLRQAESKRRLAMQEIGQLENRVDAEVHQIVEYLDELFQSDLVQKRFDEHHAEAPDILQKASLPAAVGPLRVTFEQWKSVLPDFLSEFLANSEDLEAMVQEFIKDAERHLEPAREVLEDDISDLFEVALRSEFVRAQRDIRAPFQDILIRYFSVWEGHGLKAPPFQGLQAESEQVMGTFQRRGVLALTGILLIIAGMIEKKISRKIGLKIAGRVAARAIPYVGAILLLYDVHNVLRAKAEFEKTLRVEFAAAYAQELTPSAVWGKPPDSGEPSYRQEMEEDLRGLLHAWSQHCRQEVERMLDAARIYTLSPNVKAYIGEQEELGRDSREVVEEMILVGEVFEDHLIAQTPVGQLLDMIIYSPDRQELTLLAQALGTRLLREYEQHGSAVLYAAHALGVELFLEAMDANAELDWATARRVFEQYPHDMNKHARRGLLLLLLDGMEYSGVPPSTLERIATHRAVFRKLIPVLLESDREKLFHILGDDQILNVVQKGYAQHPEFMDPFIETLPSRTWRRYEPDNRFQALFALAAYRVEERGQPASAFAGEIVQRDELTPLYRKVGLDGVRLWDAYVTPSTGEYQRALAEQAISLFRAGYPLADLTEPEGLELAAFYNRIPLLDLTLYNLLRPIGKAVYLAFGIVALLIVATPVLIFLKVGRKIALGGSKRRPQDTDTTLADSGRRAATAGTREFEIAEASGSSPRQIEEHGINKLEQNNQAPKPPSEC